MIELAQDGIDRTGLVEPKRLVAQIWSVRQHGWSLGDAIAALNVVLSVGIYRAIPDEAPAPGLGDEIPLTSRPIGEKL
jgi:hypothetical protein